MIPDASYSSEKSVEGAFASSSFLSSCNGGENDTYAFCWVELTTFLLTNAGGANAEADAKKSAEAIAVNFIFILPFCIGKKGSSKSNRGMYFHGS